MNKRDQVQSIFFDHLRNLGASPRDFDVPRLLRQTADGSVTTLILETTLVGSASDLQLIGIFHDDTLEYVLVHDLDDYPLPIWRHGFYIRRSASPN